MNQYIPVHTSTYQLVCTSMYVLAFTTIFYTEIPCYPVSGYKVIQGGTWQYMVAPKKSCTPEYGGTRKYMEVQGLVPPCISLYLHIQGYRTNQALPYTAMYSLVSPCSQILDSTVARDSCVENGDKCWYVPV